VSRIFITKWKIIDKLLEFTDFGCDKWKVPEKIFSGSINLKKSFIIGFFYGDGSIGKTKENNIRFRITSINFKGISALSKILSDIGILNNLNGPYFRQNQRPYYEILIRRASNQKFINKIISLNPAGKEAFYAGIIFPNA